MGGEEGHRPDAVVQVLRHGPGDGDAVVGGGAASDFVEHHEAAGGGAAQDVGRLAHLDHEGGLALGEVVAGADAGEDLVHNADSRRRGRHVAADLGEQDDEGDLADDGALAGHVWAGEDDDAVFVGEAGGVGDEALALDHGLDDGVAPLVDVDAGLLGQQRRAVAAQVGELGEACEHIEVCEQVGGALEAGQLGDERVAELAQQTGLEVDAAAVGGEEFLFILLQLGRDVALRVGDRLLAEVVDGDRLAVGVGDLDVIAEDPVVADLERGDAGAGPLHGLILEHPGAAIGGEPVNLVEVVGEAGPDDGALCDAERRFVEERGADGGGEVGAVVDGGGEAGQVWLALPHGCAEAGDGLEAAAERDEVARPALRSSKLGRDAVDVDAGAELLPDPVADDRGLDEGRDHALPLHDAVDPGERIGEPGAEAAGTGGGHGLVDDADEAPLLAAPHERLEDLKVGERGGVEDGKVFGAVERGRVEVGGDAALSLSHVVEQRYKRRFDGRAVGEAGLRE